MASGMAIEVSADCRPLLEAQLSIDDRISSQAIEMVCTSSGQWLQESLCRRISSGRKSLISHVAKIWKRGKGQDRAANGQPHLVDLTDNSDQIFPCWVVAVCATWCANYWLAMGRCHDGALRQYCDY